MREYVNLKEYVNPIGQRVVNVEIGCKVYDKDSPKSVILRIGDDHNGHYIYKDIEPVINNTDEICFMSESVLRFYENHIKTIQSDCELDDNQKTEHIFNLNLNCGLKGTEVVDFCKKTHKDPVKFFKSFFGEFSEGNQK